MDKQPGFYLYTNDWSRDLEEYPIEIEGAWIRIVCKLSSSPTRGEMTKNLEQWSRILRENSQKTKEVLQYLFDNKIANIQFLDNGNITIISRRMIRDERIRKIRRRVGKLGGNPNLKSSKNLVNQKSTKKKRTDNQIPEEEEERSVISNSSNISSLKLTETNRDIILINQYTEEEFFNDYNLICTNLDKAEALTETRKEKIKVRIEDSKKLLVKKQSTKTPKEFWNILFSMANKSKVESRDRPMWQPNLNWIIENDTNYLKIAESTYIKKENKINQPGIEAFLKTAQEEEKDGKKETGPQN